MEKIRPNEIADALEELVFTGEFKDGDRLDEITLAARFGVSRTPIREALQRLVVSGLAEQLPRRGVFIRQPGPMDLMEMFETMAEIEAACGRLAALRISDTALGTLEQTNARCQAAVTAGDVDGYYRGNQQFHQVIYHETGNSFLEHEALRLNRRLSAFRRVQLRWRGRMAQSMAEHETVVMALRDGNAVLAADTLRSHVAVQGERFHQLIASLRMAAQ
ncbi:hypothetical protein P775_21625 [Puniceibacterium antarcticum]|uniref:HTH gntR-type domain-containing protein n=1 Tax=Puniceibacterium antarcticum TaxID=1206336 RepID=A0A2G8R907_9RHOB|nr:GntR family transcriptional regulator [Puniceibacterium antarcticum]PIL18024.1 hypothetical protein P775_21625 [Puniceibacterium antarcticum]